MPSRRRLLATLGVGATTSLAGCLTDLGLAKTGFPQVKVVDVAWRHRGRRYRDEILWAVSDGESTLDCRVAERYREVVRAPDDIRVTEAMERRLLRDFEAVTYVVGFCWKGEDGLTCRNPGATQETFDRVQFGDRAEFVFRNSGVEVLEVYEDAGSDPDDWTIEFETFDFAALHEDNGVPIG